MDYLIPNGVLTVTPEFKPGDPAPEGYTDRHGWARVQLAAGLRQSRCGGCSRWYFPQELADGRCVECIG